MTTRWLSKDEDRAWRAYRRMFVTLEAILARELSDQTGLSMADYSVLSNLVEAEGREWRVTELAQHMQWSQSRLSHQLGRMEDRRLVNRNQSEGDGRGAVVALTRPGLKAIGSATPVHMAGVRTHMIDRLTPAQVEQLAAICETIARPLTMKTNQQT